MGFILERITESPIPQRFIGRETLLFTQVGKEPVKEVSLNEKRISFDFSISNCLELRSNNPEKPLIIPSDNSSEYNIFSSNPMHMMFIDRGDVLIHIQAMEKQFGLRSGDKVKLWNLESKTVEQFKFWTYDSSIRQVTAPTYTNWNRDPSSGLRRSLQASENWSTTL